MAGAALSGLLLGLCVRGILPAVTACFGLVPLMLALSRGGGPGRAGIMSLLGEFGILLAAFEGAIPALPWTFPAALLLAAPGAMFPGVLCSMICRSTSDQKLERRWVGLWSLPFSWTAAEFVASRRSIWGEYASPLAVGYTQFDGPLLPLAALVGVTGVTLAVIVANAAITHAWLSRRPDPLLAVVILGWLAIIATGRLQPQQLPPVSIAIVQPALNADWYELSTRVPASRHAILERLIDLSNDVEGANLVVWPEGAVPAGTTRSQLESALGSLGHQPPEVLAGALSTRNGNRFNSVFYISAGATDVVFDKLAPVPLGESGIEPGGWLSVGYWGGVWAAPLICLDSLYPSFSSRLARLGAQVLVILSDDSFSRRFATPWLHLRASAFRAVETGLPLIFASARGPSALIDSSGRIVASSDFGSATALLAELPPPRTATLYTRLGELAGIISIVITIGLLSSVVIRIVRGRLPVVLAQAPHDR